MEQFLRKKESWPRFGLKVGATLLMLWIAGSGFAGRYRIVYDPQKDRCIQQYELYLLDLQDQALAKDGLYAFSARNMEPFYNDDTPMIKYLRAMPGEEVEVTGQNTVTVNGKYVGCCLGLAERLGVPRSQFYGKTVLKEDRYWFMGTSENSFDSRYWGTVKSEQIIGRAIPLF